MSKPHERIWAKNGYDSWGQYGHWYADSKGGGVEYVRADRIEELEAKLHKAELKLEYATQELKAIEDEPNDSLATIVMKTIAKFAISELENEDRWVDPKGKYK
jgi:hypothetical protein